jgi:hypothetical protein
MTRKRVERGGSILVFVKKQLTIQLEMPSARSYSAFSHLVMLRRRASFAV